jgi:hypothetical protein
MVSNHSEVESQSNFAREEHNGGAIGPREAFGQAVGCTEAEFHLAT